jgi:segregation and condensation protein A
VSEEQRPIDETQTAAAPDAAESAAAPAGEAAAVKAGAETGPEPVSKAAKADTAAEGMGRKDKTGGKGRDEENGFPFSVTVGQVYDGPLDLLLDLIRKQDIDIYDIPIAKITAQFLGYVERLKQTDVDTAGEFIYMAALLIHIKSKMLLPRLPVEIAGDEAEDPRRELVERLLEHERFKNAAQMLAQKQQIEAAIFSNPQIREFRNAEGTEQEIAADTMDLARVFREILERLREKPVLDVEEDSVTVGQMIDYVRRRLMTEDKPVSLRRILASTRSERTLICTFLALLELVRLQAVMLFQPGNFTDILIKKQERFDEVLTESASLIRDDWA